MTASCLPCGLDCATCTVPLGNSIDRSLYETADLQFKAMADDHLLDFYRVVAERRRQEKKWGPQTHLDGTGADLVLLQNSDINLAIRTGTELANIFRARCDLLGKYGVGTWMDILLEELFEALAESDPDKLREELIQSAAVIFAWLRDIDRKADAA